MGNKSKLRLSELLRPVVTLVCFFVAFFFSFCRFGFIDTVSAQTPVKIDENVSQHIFSYDEIEYLEDRSGKLTLNDILKQEAAGRFTRNKIYTPKIFHLNSYYWFKIQVQGNPNSKHKWILEFFDQTIDDITLFVPAGDSGFKSYKFGDNYKFGYRNYRHKNFVHNLSNTSDKPQTFYIRLKSSQSASVIIVLRNYKRFLEYAIEEYLFFGLFYGMIAVFSFYNLLMYFAIRQRQYLYYILYNLSIGLYEMCTDGVAFQYLWPDLPAWNQYSYGYALFFSSLFGLLFTISFLHLKTRSKRLYKLICVVTTFRCLFFLACLYNNNLFTYKIIDLISVLAAFSAGVYILRKGYRPARFFVFGYSFLLLGFIIKILVLLNVSWLPYGPMTHYSLSVCFVIEMLLVSFAIGEKVRHLRIKKDRAQKRIISQLQINEKLKDTLNKELNSLVDQRTKELLEKATIIEKQNHDLSMMNAVLKDQAEEISRMNALLEKDNEALQVSIEKVTRARVMSQDVDFQEFSKIYPDREACFKYLASLKWEKGYTCRKCGNTNYLAGQLPYSRRCTKCRYDESVIAYTIFQNSRIPINKAFYMLFLIYSTKGKISSHKLSEILSIRQGTCWSYENKMKKIMEERRKELKNAGEKGWSKLVVE